MRNDKLVASDSNSGLNEHLDEAFGHKAEARAAAHEHKIIELADSYMTDGTKEVIDDLFSWFVDTCDPSILYKDAQSNPASVIGMMYQIAAMKKAEDELK